MPLCRFGTRDSWTVVELEALNVTVLSASTDPLSVKVTRSDPPLEPQFRTPTLMSIGCPRATWLFEECMSKSVNLAVSGDRRLSSQSGLVVETRMIDAFPSGIPDRNLATLIETSISSSSGVPVSTDLLMLTIAILEEKLPVKGSW